MAQTLLSPLLCFPEFSERCWLLLSGGLAAWLPPQGKHCLAGTASGRSIFERAGGVSGIALGAEQYEAVSWESSAEITLFTF